MKTLNDEERLEKVILERQESEKRYVKDLILTAAFATLTVVFGTNFGIHLSAKSGDTVRYLSNLGAAATTMMGTLTYGSFAHDDKQELRLQDAAIEEISQRMK